MEKVISILVPAYNEERLIAGCLDSLLAQTMDQREYEILVIDNGSKDLTARIALDKGIRVEKELHKGYVHAIRKGIEASQAGIIAFTDADCRAPADWLVKILESFKVSNDIIAVGGKLSFYDISPYIDKMLRLLLYYNQALPGNNMAIKREAICQIGGIDPGVNLSLDYWLTLRLRKTGKIVVNRNLMMLTSGRRFRGSFSSDLRYFANIITLQLSSKPLFYNFPDIREG